MIAIRRRDGQLVRFTYDALGRQTGRDLPNALAWENDTSHTYDNLGRMLSATDGYGHAQSFTYDALGRKLVESDNWTGTLTSAYDIAGRRVSLSWPDGFTVGYGHNLLGELTEMRENPSGANALLATFSYDDLGRRTALTRGNGTATGYSHTGAGLESMSHGFAGTAHDLTLGYSQNPAGQIYHHVRDNDLYSWTGHGTGSVASTVNGLNQLTSAGGTGVSHDARGNVSAVGASGYGYDVLNRLFSAPGGVTPVYDALLFS